MGKETYFKCDWVECKETCKVLDRRKWAEVHIFANTVRDTVHIFANTDRDTTLATKPEEIGQDKYFILCPMHRRNLFIHIEGNINPNA